MEPATEGLTPEDARVLLGKLTSQRDRARSLRERYQREEAGYSKVIEGVLEVFPELLREADPAAKVSAATTARVMAGRPAGMTSLDIVVKVVEETAGDGWVTAAQITEELMRRGWLGDVKNPLNTVRTSLGRVVEAGRLRSREMSGQTKGYRPGPQGTEPPVGAEGSVDVPSSAEGGGGDPSDHDQSQPGRFGDRDHGAAVVGDSLL